MLLMFSYAEMEVTGLDLHVSESERYSVVEIDYTPVEPTGISDEGQLTDAELSLVQGFATDELAAIYALDGDPNSCLRGRFYSVRYVTKQTGYSGEYHWCFDADAQHHPETTAMLEGLYELSDSLIDGKRK